MKRVVHVAVGVILNGSGKVLVALRSQHAHQGGLWEFPGGKCEPGESVDIALARELLEEVGITVQCQQPFCQIRHDYGDKEVLLDVRKIDAFHGEAVGREGQPIRWADIVTLDPVQFPSANRSIIRRLQLPASIAITGAAESEDDFFDRFTVLLSSSPAIIQLRAPELLEPEFLTRAERCLQLCRQHQTRLVLNTTPEVCRQLKAHGLHVRADILMGLEFRPTGGGELFGASCHSMQELRQAEKLGADYAFLSPVRATASHPGQPDLGWPAFERMATQVNLPVFGLGGLTIADIDAARIHGAAGIAAISSFWPAKSSREDGGNVLL